MEKVIIFLERFGYSNFKIRDWANKQIAYVITHSNSEAIEEFKKEYDGLEEGKSYKIIVGKNPNFQETKSEFLDFRKTKNTQTANKMDADLIAKMTQEAYERGMKDAEIKMLRQEVQNAKDEIKAVKDEIKELKTALVRKFDELDGKEDGDFMSKLTQGAETLEGLGNMFGGSKMNIGS